jgi:hypothetical protein
MSVKDKILKFGETLELKIIEKFDEMYCSTIQTKKPTIDLNNLEPIQGEITFYTAEKSAFEIDTFHLKNNISRWLLQLRFQQWNGGLF